MIATLVVVFPYIWMLYISFKPPDIISNPDKWFFQPTLTNWAEIVGSAFPLNVLNSLIIGGVVVAISIVLGSLAAYSFSRFNTGGTVTQFSMLSAQMFPPAILAVPLFLIMYNLGLVNSRLSLALAHMTFVLPLVTWFLIGFFDEVPPSLEEQAMIDGCSRFQALYKVVIPNIKAGMAAAGIFGFVLSWNNLFFAVILTSGSTTTAPVGILRNWTFLGVNMGKMSVAVILTVLPTMIATFFVQKHLVKGLGGGVKY